MLLKTEMTTFMPFHVISRTSSRVTAPCSTIEQDICLMRTVLRSRTEQPLQFSGKQFTRYHPLCTEHQVPQNLDQESPNQVVLTICN